MESKGAVSPSGSHWAVKNLSSTPGHVEQKPGKEVRWRSHDRHDLRFTFQFAASKFQQWPASFGHDLPEDDPDLVLQLDEIPPGDYCYGLEINVGSVSKPDWTPVWAPAVDEIPCDEDGSGAVYQGLQPPGGHTRPRIRVRDVVPTVPPGKET